MGLRAIEPGFIAMDLRGSNIFITHLLCAECPSGHCRYYKQPIFDTNMLHGYHRHGLHTAQLSSLLPMHNLDEILQIEFHYNYKLLWLSLFHDK